MPWPIAVNVWMPSANVDTVMLASPVAEIGAVPNEVVPSRKLTVPVASRPLIVYGVTLAVSVTGVPKAIVPADESSSEVDVVTCEAMSGIVGDVLPTKIVSPG